MLRALCLKSDVTSLPVPSAREFCLRESEEPRRRAEGEAVLLSSENPALNSEPPLRSPFSEQRPTRARRIPPGRGAPARTARPGPRCRPTLGSVRSADTAPLRTRREERRLRGVLLPRDEPLRKAPVPRQPSGHRGPWPCPHLPAARSLPSSRRPPPTLTLHLSPLTPDAEAPGGHL